MEYFFKFYVTRLQLECFRMKLQKCSIGPIILIDLFSICIVTDCNLSVYGFIFVAICEIELIIVVRYLRLYRYGMYLPVYRGFICFRF